MSTELLDYFSKLLDRITVIKFYLQMDLEGSKINHKIIVLQEVEKIEKEIKIIVKIIN